MRRREKTAVRNLKKPESRLWRGEVPPVRIKKGVGQMNTPKDLKFALENGKCLRCCDSVHKVEDCLLIGRVLQASEGGG